MKIKNIFCIFILLVGIVFLVVGFKTEIPKRELYYGVDKYLNGDAYNYMVEASLRGGEIAAAKISKAIYLSAGALMCAFGLVKLVDGVNDTTVESKTKLDDNESGASDGSKSDNTMWMN